MTAVHMVMATPDSDIRIMASVKSGEAVKATGGVSPEERRGVRQDGEGAEDALAFIEVGAK